VTPPALLDAGRIAAAPAHHTDTDDRLVELVRGGYDAAFDVVVQRYTKPLRRYCSRLVPASRVDDVVQQTFVSAYEAMLRSQTHLMLRPWLYRIAHNAALDVLRDPARNHAELDLNLDGVERPDQAAERREQLTQVVASLQALPTKQREAMVLRELGGETYEEIAADLGVTKDGVRQLLVRARTRLREAAAGLIPPWFLARGDGTASDPVSAPGNALGPRLAEMAGGAGAGGLAIKAGVVALVAGTVVGGVAIRPQSSDQPDAPSHARTPAATTRMPPAVRRIDPAAARRGARAENRAGVARPASPTLEHAGRLTAPVAPLTPAHVPAGRERFAGGAGGLGSPEADGGDALQPASPDICSGTDGVPADDASCGSAPVDQPATSPAEPNAQPAPGTEGTPGDAAPEQSAGEQATPQPGTDGVPATP
jgi:RNA polymerase sigma-70 factor (ECF subfamily)